MSTPARSPRPVVSRLLPAVVLVVFVAAALGTFVVTRRIVRDQERRLLTQRSDEVAVLLSGAILEPIESSLRVLGGVATSPDPAATRLFTENAGRLVTGNTATIGVAAEDGDRVVTLAAVGDAPPAGEPLPAAEAALARRALAEGQLVSALDVDEQRTRLVLALPVGRQRAVAYQELTLDPGTPLRSSPDSPFRGLSAALYASTRPDPSRLVLTTEANLPLVGTIERVPFAVGADQWLLVVGTRQPLVGGFAHNVPWFLLGSGLLAAVLATAVVEALTRRRSYAIALVEERTRDLEHVLAELRETQGFLERLLRSLPVLVVRISAPDRRITYVSPNVERLLGLTEADMLAPGFLADRIHPDDRSAVQTTLARVVAGGGEETIEYRLRDGDGTYRWLSMVGVPDTDDGRPVGIFGYALDVDDRRRAEQAQREAQEAAEAANRSKSEFLSRMSHELRTPLNAVLGFGQLLELEPLTDDQRDSVNQIVKGGRHLLDLINEVLDISRIEAGELALSPEAVLAGDLIQETVDLIRPLADQRGIQLVIDRSGPCDSYVFADRQRAKQVLLNLLSNAVKYNRPKGIIAVSCETPTATRVRLSVADTGQGIAAERLGLLFTPFERLGAEESDVEGTGIGLALSQRLAEAMGGHVSVTSTLGKGSTFYVDLPRVEGPVERYERLNGGGEPAAPPAPRRHRVLHIEDNLSNVKLVERILGQRPDVEVVAAMYGRLGLELAREHRPVLILLDLHLPDMGGDHVLQRLRDDPVTAPIPVVVISADATPGQVRRLLAAGATAYLTKPIDVRELRGVLDEALEGLPA